MIHRTLLATAMIASALVASVAAGAAHPPLHTRALNQLAPGDYDYTIAVGGHERTFILHVPPDPPVSHRPLILVFHGADETATGTIQETDLEQVADQNGQLVAFLQGYEDTWNEGAGNSAAALAHINDVAFTQLVVRKIESLVTFDTARVAAVGFSNGALMVEDLGCRLASTISLIVPVEGELPVSVAQTCAPARAVSVYEIHGTADTAIPYSGGPFVGVAGGTTVLSAHGSVARWAFLDRCKHSSSASQGSTIVLTSYTGCKSGAAVTLQTIEGGTHEWPSNIGELVTQALDR